MSDDIRAAIAAATKSVTKSWKKAKRQADRNDRVSSSRLARMRSAPRVTVREVAFEVMEQAYNKASANGKYYANARQIMYAARPAILEQCDAGEFNDVYFTQTLLKDYLEHYRPPWKVVWDARGHLLEPHTGKRLGLGGVEVADYVKGWTVDIDSSRPEIKERVETHGPANRYASALFIEKEGFGEILKHAGIESRFDMAIMSTKGIPIAAACDLIAAMYSKGVRIFVLHDFDLAGFKILNTLTWGTRLSTGSPVIDLGLRLADIEGLPAEPVNYSQSRDPADYLEQCGATAEELKFLVSEDVRYGQGWHGQRVEINAMTSDQLIAWLERKFVEHGVEKVIPNDDALTDAYRRAVFLQRLEERIEELEDELEDETDTPIPDLLGVRVLAMLKKDPALSWDEAVWAIAAERDEDES